MLDPSSRVLSAVDAARQIYNTHQPTEEQVGRVAEKIQKGLLERSEQGGATTTVASVVEYMAHRETAKASQRQRHRRHGKQMRHTTAAPVVHLYENLLKDYFQAVLLRRKVTHRSPAFHWAVTATQAIILCIGLIVIVAVTRQTLRKPFVPPEHRVIQAWLHDKYQDVEVSQIEPLESQAARFRTLFSYRVNQRRIHSKLYFTLRDGEVVDVNSAD